jgi:hypothetical protein
MIVFVEEYVNQRMKGIPSDQAQAYTKNKASLSADEANLFWMPRKTSSGKKI